MPPTFWTETSIQPFSCLLLILVCWSSSFRPKCPIGGGFFYFTPIRVVTPPSEKASFPFARSSLRRLLTSCAKQQNFHNEGTQPIYTRGCREIYLHHPTPLTGSVPKSGRLRDYDGNFSNGFESRQSVTSLLLFLLAPARLTWCFRGRRNFHRRNQLVAWLQKRNFHRRNQLVAWLQKQGIFPAGKSPRTGS